MTSLRVFALGLGLCAFAIAHDEPKGKPITMTAKVVDTGCYFSHDTKGDHAACAAMCAKKGIPLALVDDAGQMFLVVAAEHTNPNTQLIPFVEKKVKVTGTALEKNGMHAVLIKTVEEAK
jgi:hypothetical protein